MGKNRNRSRTLASVRREVAERGGHVLEVITGGKHDTVVIETADGIQLRMHLSRSIIDPYKQRGWVRQAMTNASARRR